jgi:cytochrome o ubiquinol oxidase operon protein cyoD
MRKVATAKQTSDRFASYVIGFLLSGVTTLLSFYLVITHALPADILIYVIMGIAVLQLLVQLVFFLHLGQGGRWKVITLLFALLVVLVVVVGSLWIMHNLDYNMMNMSPDQMQQYMNENEGI